MSAGLPRARASPPGQHQQVRAASTASDTFFHCAWGLPASAPGVKHTTIGQFGSPGGDRLELLHITKARKLTKNTKQDPNQTCSWPSCVLRAFVMRACP